MSAESRWKLAVLTPRPVPASGLRADLDRNPARVLSAIALASIAAAAINIAAAATVGRDSTQNLAFFVVVAGVAARVGGGRPGPAPRWWLALADVGNLVVATWVVSRTVSLPAGVYADITVPVRFPDGLATALEVVIVGAAALMIRGRGLARSAVRSPGVTVAAAVVAGALALGGVLAQVGAIGSSPTGSGQNGTGGVSGPYAPGGGGGASGGGYSGGY
jgi:hypothetical protein